MIKNLNTEAIIKFLLYLAVVILLNLAATTFFFRADMTANNKYSLSGISKQTVKSLSEPLTIKAFFSQDLPSPYNTTERYLRDLLKEYALHSNRNFNYKFYQVDPSSDKNVQKARSNGITPVQVKTIQEDEIKYKNAYMGLVIIHGDTVEKIPAINSRERLEYKLTSSMQNLKNKVSALLNLEEKVEVKLFLADKLQEIGPQLGVEGLAKLPSTVREIVSDLNTQNYQKLKFQNIQSGSLETGNSQRYKYQLQKLQWPSVPEKNIAAGSGKIGIVLEHNEKSRTIFPVNVQRVPLLGTQYSLMGKEKLKKDIDSQLKTLLGINENLGYLTSAGTLDLSPQGRGGQQRGNSAASFSQLAKDSYNLQKIDLEQGIPEGLVSMVIAGPKQEFSEFELFQIDQALMRGTNLAIFLDSYKKESAGAQNTLRRRQRQGYTSLSTGLEKLLNHYGVDIQDSVVLDENCFEQDLSRSARSNRGGKQPIYYAPIIKNKNINQKPRFMKNLSRLVCLKTAPVRLENATIKENSLQASKLFTSSENSWTMPSSRIQFNPYFANPPQDPEKQHPRPLAYYLKGKFPSYFQGKSIPKREKNATSADQEQSRDKKGTVLQSKVNSTENIIGKSREPGKIFVIGSSQILSDSVIDPQGNSQNSIFVMNVLDALNNRAAMAELRAKTQEFSPLPEMSEAGRTFVKTFNIVGLPVLVFIFGLIVWLVRNRRKKSIQRKFSA